MDEARLVIGLSEFILVGCSLAFSGFFVFLARHLPRLCGVTTNLRAVQAMHSLPVPRVGGAAIFAAFVLSSFFSPLSISSEYSQFILASSLLFVVGLAEDLGFGISPRNRLFAAVVASIVVMWLLGVWIPRVDIPGIDSLLSYWAIGVPITLLITVGITNGFNLIDGVNGLASITAVVAAVTLGLIADQGGYTVMVHLAAMLSACIFGFFLLNYPFGLIFLGDAGAYILGFVLSWFGISILLVVPDASPWAILLTLFWPVADTVLAIFRRARRKTAAMKPDRLHVHQVVMRALEICFLGRKGRRLANPLSTLILAPFVIAPPIAGVIFWDQTNMAFMAVMVFVALFFSSYSIAPHLIRRFRRCAYPIDLIGKPAALMTVTDDTL
jgi:UDP-N-acetylmuramyl pentapeptide phosphotransferase/UDP-N-acetylglucosamine-1-phosphate transferase